MLEKYIKNGEINIDEESWSRLNKKYDKDILKSKLCKHIIDGDIDFPYRKITKDEVKKDFSYMENYNKQTLFKGDIITRYDYKYKLGNKYFDCSNTGGKVSDYFQQKNRMNCGSTISVSPSEVWKNEVTVMSTLGSIWSMKMKKVNSATLRSALALRRYVASQFKPLMAKSIYDYYEAENILDFCMGWGDRLAGFYASKNSQLYVGTDPNHEVFNDYFRQIKCYNVIGKYARNKETEIYCSPAEDLNYKRYRNSMDLVFTSPPYYNKEHYSTRKNQSYIRYTDLDDWTYKFLCRTIDLAWRTLHKGGTLAVNISDIYYKNGTQQFCDKMNDFIRYDLGGRYMGCIGMKMARRPNSHALDGKEGIFIEPIWTWEKR